MDLPLKLPHGTQDLRNVQRHTMAEDGVVLNFFFVEDHEVNTHIVFIACVSGLRSKHVFPAGLARPSFGLLTH